jgi:predicted phosphoribosyltransferase
MDKYVNRSEAGKILANELADYADREDVLVLALPRGGVPVAFEVARALKAKLDIIIVRKLGVPGHAELAMGAIAMGNTVVFNDSIIHELGISKAAIDTVIDEESKELKRRETVYRGNHAFPHIKDQIIILVDDGIATGATMRAAINALKQLEPASIIVAVPVADTAVCKEIGAMVDRVVCPLHPTFLHAVGVWYDDFSQTEDDEVHALLKEAHELSENDRNIS